jgi:hypothetical protein
MPEIVFPKPRDSQIPGMEVFTDSAKTAAAVALCALLKGDADGVVPNPVDNPYPTHVALHKATAAGEWISIAKEGSVAGFETTGINPFDRVFPSAAVPGGMATKEHAIPDAPSIGSVTADGMRIVFNMFTGGPSPEAV